MGEVLSGRVVEVVEITLTVFLVRGVLPDSLDAFGHAVRHHLAVNQTLKDTGTVLGADSRVHHSLKQGHRVVELSHGLVERVGDEVGVDSRGMLAGEADSLGGSRSHPVGANQTEHTSLERSGQGAVKRVLDGQTKDKVATVQRHAHSREVVDGTGTGTIVSDERLTLEVSQPLRGEQAFSRGEQFLVLDNLVAVSHGTQHGTRVGALVAEELSLLPIRGEQSDGLHLVVKLVGLAFGGVFVDVDLHCVYLGWKN